MSFISGLGCIACKCVIHKEKPVLFVSHAGGDWQFYCSDQNHDFDDPACLSNDLSVVHIDHLVLVDPTLLDIQEMPIDMGAERDFVGDSWRYFEDKD